MKKKIFLALFLAGIAIAGFLGYMYQKPAEKTVSGQAVYTLNASDLYAQFEENEAKANEKFLNQVVAVKGKISDIEKTDSLGINITLESEGMFGVICEVTEGYENLSLKAGDSVTVKGLCTGVLMDVVLVKCLIDN